MATEVLCGIKWRESLVRYDLDSCSWKTHLYLWSEDLPWYWATLQRIYRSGKLGYDAAWTCVSAGNVGAPPTRPHLGCGTPQTSDGRKVISGFGSNLRNGKNLPELGTVDGWINPELSEWLMGW